MSEQMYTVEHNFTVILTTSGGDLEEYGSEEMHSAIQFGSDFMHEIPEAHSFTIRCEPEGKTLFIEPREDRKFGTIWHTSEIV